MFLLIGNFDEEGNFIFDKKEYFYNNWPHSEPDEPTTPLLLAACFDITRHV